MELLYFYALAHQTAFDVRWIKSRSISELLVAPLADRLAACTLPTEGEAAEEAGDEALTVLGGSFVQAVRLGESGRVESLSYRDAGTGEEHTLDDLSGCVLALGAKGMKSVMRGSPQLARRAPELCAAASLDAIDVVAVRLWLDVTVPTRTPANVFSKFPALRGAGGTFFMLDQLQNDDLSLLWGGDEPQGSVVACDFYNAGGLLPLSEEDIVSMLMEELLPAAVPEFGAATVVESYVQRYPGAVTWFSPGSYSKRPPLVTSVPNLVCAGDWVRMGDREHGAKGLCQERAYVSGLEAGNALARSGFLGSNRREHPVIPVRDDEPQVVAGRTANKMLANALAPLGLPASPWVR
uniref:Amine oxidase domain-containing protein n=1 Tax=Haptolina brevifila TaxID=156173 RepID=A0A7S2N6K8_9EUKA|mmetsp:Transcript_67761/g.134432  ORF Transcript_67761/g.134432 Transcript_67761/m.134432 type:complete len:352 (+) Transcript_67761:927-1982(+)